MRLQDIRTFLGELATLLDSGVPVADALDSLARGGVRSISRLARQVFDAVSRGEGLAESLRGPSHALLPAYVAVIEAGERSGKLPDLLRRLVEEIERQLEIRKKLLIRLAYPVGVAFLGVLLVPLFLLVQGRGGTYWLIQLGFFGPLLALGVGGWWLSRHRQSQARLLGALEHVIRCVPLLGPTVHGISLGRSLRLFGVLVESGLSFREALPLVSHAVGLPSLSRDFVRVDDAVHSGKTISESLEELRNLPGTQRLTIHTGELSGTLDRALQEGGQRILDGAWQRLDVAARLLPIVLYILLGAIIFFLLLDAYSDLYNL